jgi:hypothetical protein
VISTRTEGGDEALESSNNNNDPLLRTTAHFVSQLTRDDELKKKEGPFLTASFSHLQKRTKPSMKEVSENEWLQGKPVVNLSLLFTVTPVAQEGNGLGKGTREEAFDARKGATERPRENSATRCKIPRELSSFRTASSERDETERGG